MNPTGFDDLDLFAGGSTAGTNGRSVSGLSARSVQPKDGRQALIDSPHLLRAGQADVVSETVDVDGADLFDQHLRGLALDHYLGSEAGRSSAAGRRRDQDDRAGQEGV